MMSRGDEESGPSWRDFYELRERVEKMNGVLVDVQVRLAQKETFTGVSQDEFEPIKRLVWGAVGTILTLTLIAVLALVLNKVGTIGSIGGKL